jgi:hypothetical protein
MGQSNAKEDAKRYRDGYPGHEEKEDQNERANVEFYSNKRECTPDGEFIGMCLNFFTPWYLLILSLPQT